MSEERERVARLEAAMTEALALMEQAPDAANTFSASLNLLGAIAVLRAALATPPQPSAHPPSSNESVTSEERVAAIIITQGTMSDEKWHALRVELDAYADKYGLPRGREMPHPPHAPDRETLGRMVRDVWLDYQHAKPNPKPENLRGWDELDEGAKEIEMRMGERLYQAGFRAALAALPPATEGSP